MDDMKKQRALRLLEESNQRCRQVEEILAEVNERMAYHADTIQVKILDLMDDIRQI